VRLVGNHNAYQIGEFAILRQVHGHLAAGPPGVARRPSAARASGYQQAISAPGPPPYPPGTMAEPSRLCLVLERVSEEVFEPEFVATLPLVGFEAFVPGSRVFGWVRLDADRLTDMLNAHEELHLVNVLVEHLDDGATVTADEAIVRRGELVAVRASGPRGDASRRELTRTHPVVIESGPYLIGGHLHASPGADPMLRILGREPMVPLTEAWIAYRRGAETWRKHVGTIIVNRELATSIKRVTEQELAVAEPATGAAAG